MAGVKKNPKRPVGRPPKPAAKGSFADRLRRIRTRRGLNVHQAAAAVGVRPCTWYAWELARNSPKSLPLIRRIIQAMGCRPGDLIA